MNGSQKAAIGAVVAAAAAFGLALWASTADEGAPSWRNYAALVAAGTCAGLLGAALMLAE